MEGLLPRHLYTYEVALDRVLDLTHPETRDAIGIAEDELVGDDHTSCRLLGVGAHALGFRAVYSPSATGVDQVLGVFLQNVGQATVRPTRTEVWTTVDDLRVLP